MLLYNTFMLSQNTQTVLIDLGTFYNRLFDTERNFNGSKTQSITISYLSYSSLNLNELKNSDYIRLFLSIFHLWKWF